MNNKLILTIITICYNAETCIASTVNSVLEQKFKNFEYIIVDGLSNDNTVGIIKDILKKNKDMLPDKIKIVSEPDEGISDAFNKGISFASGKYIQFLNAGDYFLSNDSLSNVINKISENDVDIITFSVRTHQKTQIPMNEIDGKNSWEESMIPHQSTFVKNDVFERVGVFDKRFKVRMDYDFFSRCLLCNCSFICFPDPIVFYDMNGISATNISLYTKEGLAIKLLYNKTISISEAKRFAAIVENQQNVKEFDLNKWTNDLLVNGIDNFIIYGAGLRGEQLFYILTGLGLNNVKIVDSFKGGKFDNELNVYVYFASELADENNIWIISIQKKELIANVVASLLELGIKIDNIFLYDELSMDIKGIL